MTAKIYIRSNLSGTVYVTMSPDGSEFRQFNALGPAALFCAVEYGSWEVCE